MSVGTLARLFYFNDDDDPVQQQNQSFRTIKKRVFTTLLNGADDGTRTRYLHLGKVALYQMSYIRI